MQTPNVDVRMPVPFLRKGTIRVMVSEKDDTFNNTQKELIVKLVAIGVSKAISDGKIVGFVFGVMFSFVVFYFLS